MSDNEHTTVRIVDIARMAGVSVATVDRVIHNRGKVSEENLARINEVLRRVDYRPNLIARSLASGRRYTLCAVMPRFAPGEYWADFEAGIARAEAEAARYNVVVRRVCFDQYDRSSFESLLETLRREEYDGAVIATLFAEMVEPFARELDARGVPYVFVDSDLPGLQPAGLFRHVVVRRRGGRRTAAVRPPRSRGRHRRGPDHPPGRRRFEPRAATARQDSAVTSRRTPSGAGCITPRCGWTTKPTTAVCWTTFSAEIRLSRGP